MLFDEPANISCGVRMAGALKGILDLYNQEKESHKLDNENYKILHDDVTALAKYMGLEENAIIDEMYEAFDKEKEKNKALLEEIKHVGKIYNECCKVIDMMAIDYMNNHISGEYSDTPCEYYEEIEKKEKCQGKMWDDVCFGECKECLIQFYFKKARGEEDVKN